MHGGMASRLDLLKMPPVSLHGRRLWWAEQRERADAAISALLHDALCLSARLRRASRRLHAGMQTRFAPGTSSAEIRGEAPPNNVLCYEMRTGGGQDARIRVLEGRNTFVSVEGVADAQTDLSFTTEPRTYRLRVGQLMRAARPEAFRLLVSVK